MKIIGKITLAILAILVGSSLAGLANTLNVFAQPFNPLNCPPGSYCIPTGTPTQPFNQSCPPGYYCIPTGTPSSTPIYPPPFINPGYLVNPDSNPAILPVCILYHHCFFDIPIPPCENCHQVPPPPLSLQPSGQGPFRPLQSTFGRSFFSPTSTTNSTISDFNKMVIAQHTLLYNKSGLSEPRASISGLQMLASTGAITQSEFSQLSQIPIILAQKNLTSSEKASRIYLIDQTLKSQGASPAAVVIADAASNTKPTNPVDIGLRPTVSSSHGSGASPSTVGLQWGIAGAGIGAIAGGPVGAAIGGFGGAILGTIIAFLQ